MSALLEALIVHSTSSIAAVAVVAVAIRPEREDFGQIAERRLR